MITTLFVLAGVVVVALAVVLFLPAKNKEGQVSVNSGKNLVTIKMVGRNIDISYGPAFNEDPSDSESIERSVPLEELTETTEKEINVIPRRNQSDFLTDEGELNLDALDNLFDLIWNKNINKEIRKQAIRYLIERGDSVSIDEDPEQEQAPENKEEEVVENEFNAEEGNRLKTMNDLNFGALPPEFAGTIKETPEEVTVGIDRENGGYRDASLT